LGGSQVACSLGVLRRGGIHGWFVVSCWYSNFISDHTVCRLCARFARTSADQVAWRPTLLGGPGSMQPSMIKVSNFIQTPFVNLAQARAGGVMTEGCLGQLASERAPTYYHRHSLRWPGRPIPIHNCKYAARWTSTRGVCAIAARRPTVVRRRHSAAGG
jgi:hypothetical protein